MSQYCQSRVSGFSNFVIPTPTMYAFMSFMGFMGLDFMGLDFMGFMGFTGKSLPFHRVNRAGGRGCARRRH